MTDDNGDASRHRETLLRPNTPQLMTVKLILAVGSRAGLEAPLQTGYYMIGRHKECQLRPKSRSVSRRHCLLHHEAGGLRVLDLESSSGTYVNGKRLKPLAWKKLRDGAMLRCGKVLFQVGIAEQQQQAAVDSKEPKAASAAVDVDSMLTGQAWQDIDIASFLETEDDADRERRYGDIRAKHGASKAAAESDVDLFDDTFVDEDSSGEGDSDDSGVVTRREARSEKSKDAARTKRSGATSRRSKGPRRSWSIDVDLLKTIAAIVLACVMLGYLGSKVYDFVSGPSVRVVEGID